MSATSAAQQTAEDVQSEFGAPAEADGGAVTVDNTDEQVSPRVLYGYADTAAATLGLTVRYEQPAPGHIRVVYEEADR
ncbi:hypothetical protein M197_gp60 [Haloarcula hispanica tailed virus 2]|uniref:Uncharacterized protein n=1 Tax=Haloarcula hispanica tailed virus 2 TaxID=1273751 RepID=R4T8K9_9CAUD|nr:hypothetical protein M197_gp60 [Haloarcula hispanica tailed virus 2]AGM11225.1 hypothetical protein HHTV2_60 [Haloarcula hispanica tailed virus 2]